MSPHRSWSRLVVALVAIALAHSARSANAQCTYFKIRNEDLGPDNGNAYPRCMTCGWVSAGTCPDGTNNPCPHRYRPKKDEYSCITEDTTGVIQTAPFVCATIPALDLCGCDAFDMGCVGQQPDDSIVPGTYGCENGGCNATSAPDPEVCNGIDIDNTQPFDEGCVNDEHMCKLSDQDGAPTRFSSGRVEINPLTLFSLPTPDGIFFGYKLTWGSHITRKPALAVAAMTDSVPTIHHSDETTHSLGYGWLDNFSDRLYIDVKNKPKTTFITWQSMDGTVTFSAASGWKSTSKKYELIDRGPDPAAWPETCRCFGQYVVRTTDTSAPREIWAFEVFPYTSYGGASYTLGRLRRRAVLTSTVTDLNGRYGYTVDWTSDGLIVKAEDTLGRQLTFDYFSTSAGGVIKTRTVSGVNYKPTPTAVATPVIALQTAQTVSGTTYALPFLDRVSHPGVGGYTRFLYSTAGGLLVLTDVIVPDTNALQSPFIQGALLSSEAVIEHNGYASPALSDHPEYKLPLGVRSTYPGRDYAYEYRDTSTVQFDLHQPTGACAPNGLCNTAGSACHTDGQCYVASIINHPDNSTRLPTVKGRANGVNPPLTSGPGSYDRTFASGTNAPRRSTDAAGAKTTFGYDSIGRIRCIVHNDDNDEAFATPGSPDTSACAGQTAAQIIKVDYNATTIVKTTPSLLSGNVTETQALNTTTLLPNAIRTIGKTRNIAGTTITLDQSTTFTYDSIGRVTVVNGPLTDTVALDKTTTAYYTTYDGAWPFNFGQVQTVTRYVGTSSSNLPLTTTFSEYDVFGVPHRITGPNGDQTLYCPGTITNGVCTPASDRLTWKIAQIGVGGATIGVSTVQLNGDGTLRSVLAPDGVCVTYQYTTDLNEYVGAPTKMRRSNTNCGVVPIVDTSGEMEIRTYDSNEPDRLHTIERRTNNVPEFSYSGFTYDTDRRLVSASTLDSGTPFTFGYTDVLPTSTIAPGAPAPGSWRTDTTADLLARPLTLSRYLDASNKQTYTFDYNNKPLAPRPTQLSRGFNGSSTSITTFVYDDAGRLVETVVPEAGAPGNAKPTRYEYDVGNRLIKKQVGVNTTSIRTSVYTNDSLGRVTFVDHDTEHNASPVNCATLPDGTPIQDEEYVYDSCPIGDRPAGVTCANAKGRLAISRALIQCSSGQLIKRGRWYDYDSAGRVAQVAYATVTGSTIGTPAISTKTYSIASRLISWTSPINTLYGTSNLPGAADGRPTTIRTSGGSDIATAITYRAFGPATGLNTPVVQPAQGGSRSLQLRASYRADDSLSSLNWRLFGSTVATIDLLKQDFAYGPAGLITTRTDQADILSSRYYGYDALLRMTCEARGDATTQPSSGDCVVGASRLAGKFTFGNGESATSPPDVRLTAFINSAGGPSTYTSPSVETYTYSSGSGQTQQITRTGSNITIGYDGLGRRTFEYSTADPTGSRRDYTYLPNGQLGSITTYASDGTPLDNWVIRYDAEGHPVTLVNNVSGGLSFELFWDDADRLIAASRDGFRWHYHYLGQTPLAITQEAGATVKRFWIVADERGLPYRVLDDQGATYTTQRWDASGWRNIVSSFNGPLLLFGLPGQIIPLQRFASSEKRAEIALNRWRAYDPLLGAFLAPDDMDQHTRRMPEGYLYGRGNPILFRDYSGRDSQTEANVAFDLLANYLDFDDSCSSDERNQLKAEVVRAALQIETCTFGVCAESGTENLRREWLQNLFAETYHCPHINKQLIGDYSIDGLYFAKDNKRGIMAFTPYYHVNRSWMRVSYVTTATDPSMYLSQSAFIGDPTDSTYGCLANTVAHEALHWTFYRSDVSALGYRTAVLRGLAGETIPTSIRNFQFLHGIDNETAVKQTVGQGSIEGCVHCQ